MQVPFSDFARGKVRVMWRLNPHPLKPEGAAPGAAERLERFLVGLTLMTISTRATVAGDDRGAAIGWRGLHLAGLGRTLRNSGQGGARPYMFRAVQR